VEYDGWCKRGSVCRVKGGLRVHCSVSGIPTTLLKIFLLYFYFYYHVFFIYKVLENHEDRRLDMFSVNR
jgi:hypothetical protein